MICQKFVSYDVICFSDLLSISSSSSLSVVVNFKTVATIILDISEILSCLRGHFVTVLTTSSDTVLQTDLFKYS